MKRQRFLCVDLDVNTQQSGLLEGEGRQGVLTMTEDGEKFDFEEVTQNKTKSLNPKLWSGHRLNVKLNGLGQLLVSFRRLELHEDLDPDKVANEIKNELQAAKEELVL